MLRASRALSGRRTLIRLPVKSITSRCSSSRDTSFETTQSSSSTPLPPLGDHQARRSERAPLYNSTTLPPMAPPLPLDASPAYSSVSAPTSTAFNAPSPLEQLAVLNACLMSGDITRAETVARRLQAIWEKSGSPHPDAPRLCEVLPPRVHADFIKAYFSFVLTPRGLGPTPRLPMGAAQGKVVHRAWAYFDSLLGTQWNKKPTTSRTLHMQRLAQNGAIDTSVMAAMLKGLTASGSNIYDPSTLTDPHNWQRPITSLLPHILSLKLDFLEIMRESIFDITLPAYMGAVTREDVLEALTKTGQGRSGWEHWEPEMARVAEALARDREGRAEEEIVQATELDPTTKADAISVSLQTLRTNLSTLQPGLTNPLSLSPTARQRLLEESSYDAARQLYIHEMDELQKAGKDKERGMSSGFLQSLMYDWMKLLETKLLDDALGTGKNSAWGKESDIEPFLRLLSPDKMALITIVEMLRLGGSGGVSDGVKAARGILHLGKAIENEYHAELLKGAGTNKAFEREMERVATAFGIDRDNGGPESPSWNQEKTLSIMWRRQLAKREKEGDNSWRPAWSQGIRAKVGSILVTALMEVAKVQRSAKDPETGITHTETQPAFTHSYQYVRGNKLGVIKINDAITERMDQDPLRITLHPRFLPMIVKPKPWLTWESGSYLVHSTHVMRTKDSIEQLDYLRQASEAESLDNIFSGLDVLGSTPWTVNRPIFDVVTQVWNSGEALADIPPKSDLMSTPVEPDKPADMDTDPRAKDTFRHRMKQAILDKRSAHSNRCDVNYKLEIARAFLDETFYFPHNLDFRGRAYPIPPNLSHIGNDMCRGILQFAEAKPLGVRGMRWLKIHLANMRGFDKASFDEREAYAMEHLEDIFDSADKPLEGKRWWLQSDDPWQCLATCMDLAAALRSPAPTEYESRLPIHQDGTCNGLQHYAALGGDLKGAHQVNLDIGDRPSDVYSGVAAMANEQIDRDAAEGHQFALLLQGKVTRKVVKQTVMTTVYGVTFIGAKRQIEKQLKERGDIPPEHLYMCALYLGRLVLASIGDVFKGATAIQTWLNRSARLISKSIPANRMQAAQQAEVQPKHPAKKLATGLSRIPKEQMTSVIWTTPLGLPVVQPYRKPKKRQVSTALQTVFIVDPTLPAEVDPRAQATAFPPNFIHSLDATHMMMTALACKDKLVFASVHDSYWTHASSVDEMSVILRDTFIDLHSQDILGKLREEFILRYAGHVVPVSKVPEGLTDVKSEEDIFLERPAGSDTAQVVESVLADLESADGIKTTTLFPGSDVKAKAKARSTRLTKAAKLLTEAEEDEQILPGQEHEDDDETAVAAAANADAKFWVSSLSRKTDSKFILLSDVLPPVPSKGEFDLERIRESLYFFS